MAASQQRAVEVSRNTNTQTTATKRGRKNNELIGKTTHLSQD